MSDQDQHVRPSDPAHPVLDVGPVLDVTAVRFDDAGLVPAVVQQHDNGEVLMVAWMDLEALSRTLDGGETVFWSRSRRELWHKGATSGDTQRVVEVRIDCDGDTLLVLVDQHGRGACHTGERSCFGRTLPQRDASLPAVSPPAPPRWRHEVDATTTPDATTAAPDATTAAPDAAAPDTATYEPTEEPAP